MQMAPIVYFHSRTEIENIRNVYLFAAESGVPQFQITTKMQLGDIAYQLVRLFL